MDIADCSRRVFLEQSLALAAASATSACTVNLNVFTAKERTLLELVGETLAPGAREAGFVNFIETTIKSKSPASVYRLLGIPMTIADFYKGVLSSLSEFCIESTGRTFSSINVAEREGVLRALLSPNITDWRGPPAELSYLVLRSDAVDVVYGVESAYDTLNVPYLAHISPPSPW